MYGGEVVIYDLARALDGMGHHVDLFATPGSWSPPNGHLFFMRSSYGTSTPWFFESEHEIYAIYHKDLLEADVVHDFSHTHRVHEELYGRDDRRNVLSTLIGSVWSHPSPPFNLVVWSEAMRQRGLMGVGDYWNTPLAQLEQYTGRVRDAHVVPGGVDTNSYTPGNGKEDYFLWLNRFHPAKGYDIAIELARRTRIPLVLAGDHPDDAVSPDHREGALHALMLAKDLDNAKFKWLPREGHHEAKRRLLQRARALLYTIRFQEPFGLLMPEALACGTPIIGTDYGSVAEIVRNRDTGFVCSTMEELEAAVQDVDQVRSEDCRRDAVDRFDRRVMARNYLSEYRKVIDGECWGLE